MIFSLSLSLSLFLDTAGILRVRLHRAVQLMKKDVGVLGMGKSDPYATLTVGARTAKTKKINNTVNPEWNFAADFPIEVVRGQQLTLEVFDHDDPGEGGSGVGRNFWLPARARFPVNKIDLIHL